MVSIKVFLVTALFEVLNYFAVRAEQPALCQLQSETGVCRAAIPRYFYDITTGSCRRFIYGGCGGNANNFRTFSECRAACTCTLELSSGNRGCNSRGRRQFYYDTTSGSCKRFRYSGCGGNQNRFRSASLCRNTCATAKCYLPSETGRCKAYFGRYFYNSDAGKCQRFVWGGCDGNGNNFRSMQMCKEQCASPISPSTTATGSTPPSVTDNEGERGTGEGTGSQNLPSACLQPKIVGWCRAALSRFYYNSVSGSCESFIYGGCQGNDNNFKSLSACEMHCGYRTKQSISTLSPWIWISNESFRNGRPLNSTLFIANSTDPTTTGMIALSHPLTTKPTIDTHTANITSGKTTAKSISSDHTTTEKHHFREELQEKSSTEGTTTETDISSYDAMTSESPTSATTTNVSLAAFSQNVTTEGKKSPPYPKKHPMDSGKSNLHSAFGLPITEALDKTKENKSIVGRCQLPKSRGPCQNYTTMFSFHWPRGRCKPFVYGGCQGNANRFHDIVSCMRACIEVYRESKLLSFELPKALPRVVLPWFPSLGLRLNAYEGVKHQMIRYMLISKHKGNHVDMERFRRIIFGPTRQKRKDNT